MINPLFTYVFGRMFTAFVGITLVLTAVVWLSQSLRFIDYIVNRGLSLTGFLSITLMVMPSYLALLLPLAMVVALINTYWRLTSDSELIVMRAMGLNQWQLALPGLALTLVVMIFGGFLTLDLTPSGYRQFKDRQTQIRDEMASILVREGAFNPLGDGLTIYVRERSSDGELRGILMHDARNELEISTIMAASGLVYRADNGELRALMRDGNRQTIDKTTGNLSLLYFDSYKVDLSSLMSPGGNRFREATERFLGELFNPGDDLDSRNNADKFLAEAHRRLAWPLFPLALAMVAMAATVGGGYNRRGQIQRVWGGIGAVVLVQLVMLAIPQIAARAPVLNVLSYLVPLLIAFAAARILMRTSAFPMPSWLSFELLTSRS